MTTTEQALNDLLQAIDTQCGNGMIPWPIEDAYAAYQSALSAAKEVQPQAQGEDYKRGFSDGMNEAPTGECWIRVIDEAMVGAHLGVADIGDDYGTAKEKLNALICWSVQVDRDLSNHQASEPAWLPIETAPKNGRKIIVTYTNRNNFKRTVMACWFTKEQAEETDNDGVGLEEGWYECIDNWGEYTSVAIHEGEPTHWMPLPAAPEATK